MSRAWEDLLTTEWGRVRERIRRYENPVLPKGRIPVDDHDDVAHDAFLRLHTWLKLQGSSIGEARAIINQNLTWQIGDYVDRHVREDRRRAGSFDETAPGEDVAAPFAVRAEEEASAKAPDGFRAAEARSQLLQGLRALDDNKREVVELMIGGWSASDVADRLGITRDNVYQLNKRGMDQLRAALGDDL